MPNTRYKKGYRTEKKSRAYLEASGYFVVEARGSHGACDLVAISEDHVVVVQVKSGRKVTPSELAEMKQAMAKIPAAHFLGRELHYWPDRAREPIVEVL